jgi:hypothetical protein
MPLEQLRLAQVVVQLPQWSASVRKSTSQPFV